LGNPSEQEFGTGSEKKKKKKNTSEKAKNTRWAAFQSKKKRKDK